MDVALATCAMLPEPDADEVPLLTALRETGVQAASLAWDDPTADFSQAQLTVVRATWNYPEAPAAFLAWAEKTARVSILCNPLPVLRWNLHKRYLLDLERAGVPVVPTELVAQGSRVTLAEIRRERGFETVVVKPAISAGSRLTKKVGPDDQGEGEAHLARLIQSEDALVQPYLPSVEAYGERALVWIDGELVHAVRKSPRFLGDAESVAGAQIIHPEEEALAQRAMAAIPHDLLYARVDMAPGEDGRPIIMELELIEPSLFFTKSAAALDRMTAAIRKRLARSGHRISGHGSQAKNS